MPWSWVSSCFRSGSTKPRPGSPRPSGRRLSVAGAAKLGFHPTLDVLEDRTVPSGFGGFGGFGDFGDHSSHFPPAGPATHLQVIVPEDVQAGQTFKVVVVAEDASNRVATGFTDAVSLSSSDTTATGTATPGSTLSGLPLSYTFTAADHGAHVFQVSLTTLGSESVATSDSTATTVTSGSATTTVNPAPTLAQLIVVTPETAAVGVPTRVIVAAVDASGHLLRNFTGTVNLSTSDTAATGLPATYTFTASDHGVHSFSVTFETADTSSSSPTTITATDGSITGTASLIVDPATTVTHFAIFAEGPAVSGTATPVKVVALNASNQVVTGYAGTVTLSSSDTTATASATSDGTQTALSSFSYTFTAGDAGKHTFYVTFGTTGKQTLTVSNSDGSVTNTTYVRVVSTLSHHGWWWF